jgi:hypothetical protein
MEVQQIPLGRETTVPALGRTWTVGRREFEIWQQLVEWAAPRIKNPLEYLKPILGELPPGEAIQLVREVLAECPRVLTVDHPLVRQAVEATLEGRLYRFWLLLRQHHPDVTLQEAGEILTEIGEQEERKVVDRADGSLPAKGKKKGAARSADAGRPAAGSDQLARGPGQPA